MSSETLVGSLAEHSKLQSILLQQANQHDETGGISKIGASYDTDDASDTDVVPPREIEEWIIRDRLILAPILQDGPPNSTSTNTLLGQAHGKSRVTAQKFTSLQPRDSTEVLLGKVIHRSTTASPLPTKESHPGLWKNAFEIPVPGAQSSIHTASCSTATSILLDGTNPAAQRKAIRDMRNEDGPVTQLSGSEGSEDGRTRAILSTSLTRGVSCLPYKARKVAREQRWAHSQHEELEESMLENKKTKNTDHGAISNGSQPSTDNDVHVQFPSATELYQEAEASHNGRQVILHPEEASLHVWQHRIQQRKSVLLANMDQETRARSKRILWFAPASLRLPSPSVFSSSQPLGDELVMAHGHVSIDLKGQISYDKKIKSRKRFKLAPSTIALIVEWCQAAFGGEWRELADELRTFRHSYNALSKRDTELIRRKVREKVYHILKSCKEMTLLEAWWGKFLD